MMSLSDRLQSRGLRLGTLIALVVLLTELGVMLLLNDIAVRGPPPHGYEPAPINFYRTVVGEQVHSMLSQPSEEARSWLIWGGVNVLMYATILGLLAVDWSASE